MKLHLCQKVRKVTALLAASGLLTLGLYLIGPVSVASANPNLLQNPSFSVENPAGPYFVDCTQPVPITANPTCVPNNSSGLQPTGAADWGMWDYANGNGVGWAENDWLPTTLSGVAHAGKRMLHVSGTPGAGILQVAGSEPLDTVTWSVWVDPLVGGVSACIGPIGSGAFESCDTTSSPCSTITTIFGTWDQVCGTYDNTKVDGQTADEMLIGGATPSTAPYTDFYVGDASWSEAPSTTGATLYVATTGHNTDANGSANTCLVQHLPCATISYAVSHAVSGDTIDVAGGTYTDNVQVPGSLVGVVVQGSTSTSDPTVINGNQGGSVFSVEAGANVVLQDLTMINGSGTTLDPGLTVGGGVAVLYEGSATLTDDTISGSSSNYGGGGLFNQGHATLSDDTINGNTSLYGGGVDNFDGQASLTDVTIQGNTASGNGGGIDTNGTTILDADTIAANTADVSAGAIYNYGPLALTATLIGSNTQSNPGVCANITTGASGDGVIADQGYNLDPDGTCGLSTSDHDVPGVNADLGLLQLNHGQTATMVPAPGSPALAAIHNGSGALPSGTYPDPTLCGTTASPDQQGLPRPQQSGAACDIGSVEVS